MRVSERHRYHITHSRVERAKSDNADQLEKISTQKRINRISDDPVAAGQAIRERGRIKTVDRYLKNIDYAKGFVERTETALSGLADNLIRARELAVGLANATYDENSREAASREIRQIIDDVVGIGNATFANRYVFGGFRSQTPPLSLDGTFLGDDGAVFLEVDRNEFKQINLQARKLFEADSEELNNGHFGIVHALSLLFDGLADDDMSQIRKSMDEITYQLEKTTSFQATLGAIWNALEGTGQRSELTREISQEKLSRLEDVDAYQAVSDFKRTETVLQSTLMASNKLLQPSLLNFMQ